MASGGEYKTRPGTAQRATVAFFLLNIPLFMTTYFVYWMGGQESADWWLRGILAIGFAAAEFAIVFSTITEPLYEWIKGKEYVPEGQKASWEK